MALERLGLLLGGMTTTGSLGHVGFSLAQVSEKSRSGRGKTLERGALFHVGMPDR
jgi:hypothetical protein